MTDALASSEAVVHRRYKTALQFSVPLFVGLALMLLDGIWGISVLPPGGVLLCIIIGLLIAAVPVTRYQRAKSAYDREVKMAKLAALAEAFETKP